MNSAMQLLQEYKQRRELLCERIGDAHALIVGAPAPKDRAPFRQFNDFYYLCGVETPQSYLLIDGKTCSTNLFLPSRENQSRERDEKVFSSDEPELAVQQAGVDAVLNHDELTGALQSVSQLYTFLRDGEGLKCDVRSIVDAQRQTEADPWDGCPGRGMHFIERVRSVCPGVEVLDLAPILLEMRMVKSPLEIEYLRRAGQLSAKGICEAMLSTRPGVMEYELAAVMQYHYLAGGSLDNSYAPIVASGKDILDPHYCANTNELKDGGLVLVDCAPDYHYYTSDITRMWPVNGTYTDIQRTLYGFVTAYHKALLAAIRPGRMVGEIEEEVGVLMRDCAKNYAFKTEAQIAAVEKMCQCRNHIAHSVGMSVHDGLGHKSRALEPGMVFAVDPQLWLKEEDLYIRVEDTGVVTEDGFEIFTKDAPLDLDEIEKLVIGEGILQSNPPLKWKG